MAKHTALPGVGSDRPSSDGHQEGFGRRAAWAAAAATLGGGMMTGPAYLVHLKEHEARQEAAQPWEGPQWTADLQHAPTLRARIPDSYQRMKYATLASGALGGLATRAIWRRTAEADGTHKHPGLAGTAAALGGGAVGTAASVGHDALERLWLKHHIWVGKRADGAEAPLAKADDDQRRPGLASRAATALGATALGSAAATAATYRRFRDLSAAAKTTRGLLQEFDGFGHSEATAQFRKPLSTAHHSLLRLKYGTLAGGALGGAAANAIWRRTAGDDGTHKHPVRDAIGSLVGGAAIGGALLGAHHFGEQAYLRHLNGTLFKKRAPTGTVMDVLAKNSSHSEEPEVTPAALRARYLAATLTL